MARAAPDGYTISVGDWSTHVINGAIYYTLTYDVLQGLRADRVAAEQYRRMDSFSKNAVARKEILKELVAWLKANPGQPVRGERPEAGAPEPTSPHCLLPTADTAPRFQFVPYRGDCSGHAGFGRRADRRHEQSGFQTHCRRSAKARSGPMPLTSKARLDVAA